MNREKFQEIEITIKSKSPNYEYQFHYMIDARAKMGTDNETGEYCEIYARITPGFEKEVPTEIQEQMHVLYGEELAEQFRISPEYVHPISAEQYKANVAEDIFITVKDETQDDVNPGYDVDIYDDKDDRLDTKVCYSEPEVIQFINELRSNYNIIGISNHTKINLDFMANCHQSSMNTENYRNRNIESEGKV